MKTRYSRRASLGAKDWLAHSRRFKRSMHGHVEWLESRRLLAAPQLVRDINSNFNPFGEPSSPSEFAALGNVLYFSADAGDTNGVSLYRELWKSDGTATGTVLVKDIWPDPDSGFSSSYPDQMTQVGSTLFFIADDGTTGRELWKTDGTLAGTIRVKEINPTGHYLRYGSSFLTNVNGLLFFSADDGTNGVELWKSDGTEAGTVRVKDIYPGADSSDPRYLTNVAGTLYFSAKDATFNIELWKSDGTEAGTVRVKDIVAGATHSSAPSQFCRVGSILYFSADDDVSGRELWKTDGTEAGTVRVKDIRPGTLSSEPYALTNVAGTLYFRATNGPSGYELWKSDGTEVGTVLVKDIVPGPDFSFPQLLTDVDGTLFFIADDGTTGRELWKSDGTEAGTVRVKDIRPGTLDSEIEYMTNVNGRLFFSADDGATGRELWTSDGTESGTVLVHDIFGGPYSSYPGSLTNVGGTLFFSADDGAVGRELWKLAPDPVSASLPFSDGFGRADGTSLGNVWIETLGNLGIDDQKVVLFQNTESTAVLAGLSAADVSISAEIDLSGAEIGRSVALMARSQGPGDANAYWGVYYRSDSAYAAQIYKNVGGVATALRSVPAPGPAGTLRFDVIGTTLNCYFNDVLLTSVIDDALLAAGAIGIRQTGGSLDNFSAQTAVPPPSQNAVLPFADDFNRPDNNLFGPLWTERSGDTGVRNSAAGLYANDTSVVTVNGISAADVRVSADIDITDVPGQFSSGLLARYSGPGDANTYMARLYRSDSGLYAAQIWKNIGGAYSPLRSVIVPSGAGHLRFEVVGPQLQLFFNDQLVASTIDASIPGPGQVGMRLGGGTADNFTASELAPPPQSDASLPFLDDFNRADNSSLGEFWTETAGDLGVHNQQVELFAGEQSVAIVNGVAVVDVDVSAFIDITGGGNAGLLARYSGPGDSNAYMGLLQPASGGTFAAQIWKNTGAGWENLTHSAIGAGAGELRFLLEGDHLQLFFDDVLVGDVVDTAIAGAGTVGVRQGGGAVDDFSAVAPEIMGDGLFPSEAEWALDALLAPET